MQKQRILLIGGGGRESALAWKIAQSEYLESLFIAPGNPGTERYGTNVAIDATDIYSLCDFAVRERITLCIIGPDDPLALGIVDSLRALRIPVFGPTKAAAHIEWSKAYAKELMQQAGVPTASYATHHEYESALTYIQTQHYPLVIKASGLALGKGVYICSSRQEAESALQEIMLKKVHRNAGETVVIEQFLEGKEISAHAITDGATTYVFPPAQDHKRIGENNTGKNTGGMGTIAPVPWIQPYEMNSIEKSIVFKTLHYLEENNTPFTGCLFPGIMVTEQGPYTLEFNARFGDPETQVYMRLLESDLVEVLYHASVGSLSRVPLVWSNQVAVNIVLASQGYPDSYVKGIPIKGIEEAEKHEGIVVFHAGTKVINGSLVTHGGRVLGVSSVGMNLADALERAYKAIECITFEGMYYRKDIGASSL